jgi:Tol biopolymer transport system component
MKAIAILLALGLAGPLLSSAQAAEVTPELIADLTMEEEVRLSADGKWVSYIVGVESGGEGGRAKELWMASVDGAPVQRRLLPDRSRVLVARWSPDGRLAVIAQSEDTPRRRQLLVLEPGTGVMHVLADRFDGDSVEWSPDGRQLGFVRSESTGSGAQAVRRRAPGAGCGPRRRRQRQPFSYPRRRDGCDPGAHSLDAQRG